MIIIGKKKENSSVKFQRVTENPQSNAQLLVQQTIRFNESMTE
jgi:hypothetical protein